MAGPKFLRALIPLAGCVLVFVVSMPVIIVVFGWRTGARRQAERTAKEAHDRVERAEREKAFQADAATAAVLLLQQLEAFASAERQRDLAAATAAVDEMNRLLAPYETLADLPAILAEPTARARAARTKHAARTALLANYEAVRENERRAKALMDQKDWIGADKLLGQTIALLDQLHRERETLRPMRAPFAATERKAAIERERRRIAPHITQSAGREDTAGNVRGALWREAVLQCVGWRMRPHRICIEARRARS